MQANESTWYNQYHQAIQGEAPWHRFSFPYITSILTPQAKVIELGCGQAHLLRRLAHERWLPEASLYGVDQSHTAIDHVKKALPSAHIEVGDIYQLSCHKNYFTVCILMETIEHLADPMLALEQVQAIMVPGSKLIISFPNFLNLPWLVTRLLGDMLHKPNWLVRQPIDKIYTVPRVIQLVKQAGFKFERGIGSSYGPPIFYPLEKDWMTSSLNFLKLWWLSFHPILIFTLPLNTRLRRLAPTEMIRLA